ncbi:MAG: DUF3109 family protein [Bacteroidetes bacterium]|nr:DUF3109 family protein [Bacteroidota bacterium]
MAYKEFGDVSLDTRVLSTSFACDLPACRGACCTIPGGRGAPIREDEVAIMHEAARVVRPLLSPRHLEILEAQGPLEGPAGDRTTICVDGAACVFVVDDAGIAVCSIERLYHQGRFGWRKPVSCHLYPIRIDQGSPERVRYEESPICRPARDRGEREGIQMADFLSEALERVYGTQWTASARNAAAEGLKRI